MLLRFLRVALAPVLLVGVALAASPSAAAAMPTTPKVAIIVGPTGSMTPHLIDLANRVARAARNSGATVAKAYSPNAYPRRVLRAVRNANVVVYFGHGNGYPNPYNSVITPSKVDGWGLQGPNAYGTHADSWSDGTLKYYGESWIANHAHPAHGWVMIYSQACYTAGSSEPQLPPSTWHQAKLRTGYYSRTPLRMASKSGAYFATNHGDANELVRRLLRHPWRTYAWAFRAGDGYRSGTQRRMHHPMVGNRVLWLSPTRRSDGKLDFSYAFAGRPKATPAHTWH